jgi:hypothetical protein
MSRSGTFSSRRQRGQSLVAVVGVTVVMGLLVSAAVAVALHSSNASARDARGDLALQAAQAGLDQFLARLVADPKYWDHYVDKAEDPRYNPADCTQKWRDPGQSWVPGVPWRYCGSSTTWVSLQNARFGQVSYSLRITPPATNSDIVTIQATGRAGAAGATTTRVRSVQAQVRPASLADFQAIANVPISYGSTAVTTGKIYSNQSVRHDGIATKTSTIYAPVVTPHSSNLQGGYYDDTTNPSFSSKFPTRVDFSQFQTDLSTIEDAALTQGNRFDDASLDGWLLQFTSAGQANVWKITDAADVGSAITVNCSSKQTRTVTNATLMYFVQPVVVGTGYDPCNSNAPLNSVVNGRVTVASPNNLYVGGNISYGTSGDDSLGLLAGDDLIIARYAPDTVSFRAATLAQSGQWHTWSSFDLPDAYPHTTMTFTGSQGMANGGYASMYANRAYNYDPTLQYTRPPLFPTIDGTWTTQYWHEVTPP